MKNEFFKSIDSQNTFDENFDLLLKGIDKSKNHLQTITTKDGHTKKVWVHNESGDSKAAGGNAGKAYEKTGKRHTEHSGFESGDKVKFTAGGKNMTGTFRHVNENKHGALAVIRGDDGKLYERNPMKIQSTSSYHEEDRRKSDDDPTKKVKDTNGNMVSKNSVKPKEKSSTYSGYVGETKSGLMIHSNKKGTDEHYKGITAEDHREAAQLHASAQQKATGRNQPIRSEKHSKIADSHYDEATRLDKEKQNASKDIKELKKNYVSFDHNDTDEGINDFKDAFEEAGGSSYDNGDYLFLSKKPITKEQIKDMEDEDNGIGLDAMDKYGWSMVAKDDEADDMSSTFKAAFKELGYNVKDDKEMNGSDMYGFHISPKVSKAKVEPKEKQVTPITKTKSSVPYKREGSLIDRMDEDEKKFKQSQYNKY